jgi:hypothetical protein
MRDVGQPSVRIHRVTTRRRSLHALQCPLEPELLVAEFAGELPPDVALAVREHIAVCETCGARSRALRSPYELLAALGNEPVPRVPDLRDAVRWRARRGVFYQRLLRAAGVLGRGGALGMAGIISILAVVAVLVVGVLYSVNAQALTRSANGLTNVAAGAASGTLLAVTDKLVAVKDAAGRTWQVAEVIVVDERNGVVRRSLPAGSGSLHTAQSGQLPVAVAMAPDGSAAYELTAPGGQHQQALVAIDVPTGTIQFVTPLALPGSTSGLPAASVADALAVAPAGDVIYVGLTVREPKQGGVRVLTVDAQAGTIEDAMAPTVSSTIPIPPPPGGLPISVFPRAAVTLDASQAAVSLAAGGELAVSPDGRWLFDVLALQMPDGSRYGVVRRISTLTGVALQELALAGDFTLARLTASGGPHGEVVLVKGSPDAQCFVLDAGAKGPTLLGDVALGGPAAPDGVRFSGTLSVSVAADDHTLYITQNASAANDLIEGHDLWEVDTQGMNVLAHRLDENAADAVLANNGTRGSGGQPMPIFIIRGGAVLLLSADLTGGPTPWLTLADGHPVRELLATLP